MANECKKFALLCCCLMTMQALRLVISTAGFCAVRFHIDCALFNIFISRLVNAVYMAQLFGNWLGDVIVFGVGGPLKLYSIAFANWIEFLCFCTALGCFCSGEQGMLTGFYWSMVLAYFWWKVGEAPCTSIAAPNASDYYFAGFTLSGVWAAMLKAVVMWCIHETSADSLKFHSDPLGDVNVKLVGARSVKTTVDYRGAKWLYIVTIVLTSLMCLAWTAIAMAVDGWRGYDALGGVIVGSKAGMTVDTVVARVEEAIKTLATTVTTDPENTQVNLTNATKEGKKVIDDVTGRIEITLQSVSGAEKANLDANGKKNGQPEKNFFGAPKKVKEIIADAVKTELQAVDKEGKKDSVDVRVEEGESPGDKLKVTVTSEGWIEGDAVKWTVAGAVGITFGGVLSVPGAMLGAGVLWGATAYARAFRHGDKVEAAVAATLAALGLSAMAVLIATAAVLKASGQASGETVGFLQAAAWVAGICGLAAGADVAFRTGGQGGENLTKWFTFFGIVGALGGFSAGLVPGTKEAVDKKGQNVTWVAADKWAGHPRKQPTTWSPLGGLGSGLIAGATLGLCIGACKGSKKRGTTAGAFFGSFFGLISGEIANGYLTWDGTTGWVAGTPEEKRGIAVCGVLIVVLGLGTVYSIYPGMAPCSITQFKYFNIIDILILILSSIGPLVIMYADLAEANWKLAGTILFGGKEVAKWTWVGFGIVFVIATLVCEILVLSIMQHPFSKMAHNVTTSGSRAVVLTVTMVTSQLVSSGVGFGCVAAGSGFNDGVLNVNSTLVLWTIECCGVLGEGYLTELKKYEPGKWPTQGMGKWDTYWWWNNRAFGNAWQIWCCIGTTNLRRDIMLCKQ